MSLGRIEFLLVTLILAIGGYLAVNYFHLGIAGEGCGPVAISDEVKAYIDQKLSAPANADTDPEAAALRGRIAEMEKKLANIAKVRKLREEMLERRKNVMAGWTSTIDLVTQMRNAEVDRFRGEVAKLCAGVPVNKPAKSGAAANQGSPGKENVSTDVQKK